MPRVKRCENGKRRKPRKTGKCTQYDKTAPKKYVRCKNGERKQGPENKCEPYTYKAPKWGRDVPGTPKRCKKGTRKDANGDCKKYSKKKGRFSKSDDSDDLRVDSNSSNKSRPKSHKKKKIKSSSSEKYSDDFESISESIEEGIPASGDWIEALNTEEKRLVKNVAKKWKAYKKPKSSKKSSLNTEEKRLVKKVAKKWKTFKKPKPKPLSLIHI